jgi:hypothetical protein
MFRNCSKLEHVPLFDTSSVASLYGFCEDCALLREIPQLDFSRVTNANYAFSGTWSVTSGALAAYTQMASLATPPSHVSTFEDCGQGTSSGRAELAQIPSDWK